MRHYSRLADSLLELRGTLRGLVHKPGYATASIVMLALALAANGAVFSLVYGFLLRPLPYAAPQRLVMVTEYDATRGTNIYYTASSRVYLALRKTRAGIADVGMADTSDTATVEINGATQAIFYNQVTPSAFSTVGTQPLIGRWPSAQAGKPGGAGEAVLSYGLWQSAFNGSPKAIGQMVKVQGTSYRITGVMPPHFFLPYGGIQMWVTEAVTPAMTKNGGSEFVIARLAPGVTLKAFNTRLETVRAQLLNAMTPSQRNDSIKSDYTLKAFKWGPGLRSFFGGGARIWLLEAAALLLLFLAFANTVNLTLARQQDRLPELATRYAVGASRGTLLRHAATEAILIVGAAGALAMILTWAGITGINAFGIIPQFSPFYINFGAPVVAFILVLMLASILCLFAATGGVARARRLLAAIGHGPGATHGRGVAFMQRTLAAMQTGLACALLIAAFLLGMSLWNLFTRPLGFQPQKRVVMQVFLPQGTSPASAFRQLSPALSALPRVRSIAASRQVPYRGYGSDFTDIFGKDGQSLGNHPAIVRVVSTTNSFFGTLAIPLVHGGLPPKTGAAANHDVVISSSVAKRLFDTTNAVGHTINVGGNQLRVVGVVRDILWQATPNNDAAGIIYLPLASNGYSGFVDVITRIRGTAAEAIPVIKRRIEHALPGSAVYQTHTMENLVRGGLALRAVAAGLVGQGRSVYDRCRGRLLWPIRDASGDTIGFGARRLFDDDRIEAKYLNTSETALYKKSQVLYGIDLARRDMARSSQAVVVEGYTDVMACHLSGVKTAVATCGTAFGEDHARVLRRLLRDQDELRGEVIFTFDGDEAGQHREIQLGARHRISGDDSEILLHVDQCADRHHAQRHRGDAGMPLCQPDPTGHRAAEKRRPGGNCQG